MLFLQRFKGLITSYKLIFVDGIVREKKEKNVVEK